MPKKRSLEDTTSSNRPKFVTTGGAGYIPSGYGSDYLNDVAGAVRRRLYRNITPRSYYKPANRVYDAIINNIPDTIKYKDAIAPPDNEDVKEQLDNIFATYLKIPEKERRSSHKRNRLVSNGDGTYSLGHIGTIYDTVMDEGLGYDRYIDYKGNGNLHRFTKAPLKLGESRWINAGDVYLGDYNIARKYDNNGEYIEYSDTWDINPYKKSHQDFLAGSDLNLYGQQLKPDLKTRIATAIIGDKGDASFGIGNPVKIKGKFYLNDYYGVPRSNKSTYLPEVTVLGNKRSKPKPKRRTLEDGGFAEAYNNFKEEHPTLHTVASYLPVVGTAIDGAELIANPSWENAANFGISLGSDILGYRLLRNFAKGTKAIRGKRIYQQAIDKHNRRIGRLTPTKGGVTPATKYEAQEEARTYMYPVFATINEGVNFGINNMQQEVSNRRHK